MSKNILTCSEGGCSSKAAWVLCCQFAGDHPYCEKHAKLEPTFGDGTNSHFIWLTVKQKQENERKYQERQKKEAEEYAKKIETKQKKLQAGLNSISVKFNVSVKDIEAIVEDYNNLRRTL